jgi:hypothetical protein
MGVDRANGERLMNGRHRSRDIGSLFSQSRLQSRILRTDQLAVPGIGEKMEIVNSPVIVQRMP